ncbi:MAG: PEP-CTERM sorting domain-containing protein [Myxococcota bacterium]
MLAATSASAAPVVTTGSFTLEIQGLAPIGFATAGTVSVSGSTVVVPAGYVVGAPLTVPVTASTAIAQIKLVNLTNLTGTFSPGGAGGIGETCPPAAGQACVTAGGIGGTMALTGIVNVSVIPNVVVIPVNLNGALLGQGGSATTPFTFDAAPWTTGIGQVNTGTSTVTLSGSGTASVTGISLITPTYVSALGNLLPIFTRLTLDNVHIPEPGTLMLLGAGVAGLVVVGRRRK